MSKYIFWIGIFLIPFDNLPFAPSSGWAALSPYFFLLFVLVFFLEHPSLAGALMVKAFSSVAGLFLVLVPGGLVGYYLFGFEIGFVVLGAVKLLLGFCFYVSLVMMEFFGAKWRVRALKILLFAYCISLLVGVLHFIGMHVNIGVASVLEVAFARFYPNRVQFTFTEPSFTSMHVFGVLLFFSSLVSAESHWRRRSLMLGSLFLLVSFVSGSSLRLVADVFLILFAYVLSSGRQYLGRAIVFVTIALGVGFFLLPPELEDRIYGISSGSDRPDVSSEVRAFRVQSAIYGMMVEPVSIITGYGFSNISTAMNLGFDDAVDNIRILHQEIDRLLYESDGLVYSMHAKWVVEHGVIGYVLILIFLYSRRFLFHFLVVMILYMQFDSYAFYTLWLYLFLRFNSNGSSSLPHFVGR